jgi:hypothetical protein
MLEREHALRTTAVGSTAAMATQLAEIQALPEVLERQR